MLESVCSMMAQFGPIHYIITDDHCIFGMLGAGFTQFFKKMDIGSLDIGDYLGTNLCLHHFYGSYGH